MEIDMIAFRNDLIHAIDDVISRHTQQASTAKAAISTLTISRGKTLVEDWDYRWPQETETFYQRTLYNITSPSGKYRVIVARCKRHSWNRVRGRVVVFGVSGQQASDSFYPWGEFIEADDKSYVSQIPDPNAPRSMLTDGSPLPSVLAGATIRRTDECFLSVKNGPSLRLVLNKDDEESMVRHAYWIASLRGRIA